MTALRQRLLEVFEIEYQEHLEAIRKILVGFEAAAPAAGDLTEATRRAHSLKGAARAVGLGDVERLAHDIESLFIKVQHGETALDRDLNRHLLDQLDEVEDCVVASHAADAGDQPPMDEARVLEAPAGAGPSSRMQPEENAHRVRPTAVRVETSNLDGLLKSAGELHADMLVQRLGAQETRAIAGDMSTLEADWARLWKHLSSGLGRNGPSHAAARMLEGGEQIGAHMKALSRRLTGTVQSLDRCARSLHHHLDDLEGRVKAARMVPAESAFGGFRKMVRDLAASEGKQVEVQIEGLECQADRLVLQRIKDPVMHMLRNAVSHGIELPSQRQAAGKPPEGRVGLRISAERDRLAITIEDDGRGIDFDVVADKAVQQGLLSKAGAEAASDDSLCQFLFEPGFSTAPTVTRISGRGVGLSVARESVTSLQGTVSIHADAGMGTRIDISLPLSVLSRRLLLVSFRNQTYAFPSDAVVKALRVNVNDVVAVEGRPTVKFAGGMLPLASIGDVLRAGSDATVSAERDSACVVVLRNGSVNVGVLVDEFVGVNDFVVRNLDIGGVARPWSGVIRVADGSPCLVLNADAFAASESARRVSKIVFKSRQQQSSRSKVVLVVDDSITTRTLEKSILEAHGYKVRLSVDGRDAIGQLRCEPADIVVSDIEMPHVNGFELVRSMKADKALADIPVILVTSRDDPKDRERGLELGADAYIVKQKFDQADLLRTIEQII